MREKFISKYFKKIVDKNLIRAYDFLKSFLRRCSRVSVTRGMDGFWRFLDRKFPDASRSGWGPGRLVLASLLGFALDFLLFSENLLDRQELADA